MDISKINELLKENEDIKQKIIKLKRKLNLKNYTNEQKEEINYLIKKLMEVYVKNQSICSNLSVIKAGTFAKLVCNKLNKFDLKYKAKCISLNLPKESRAFSILKHFKNQENGIFLIVTNKEIQSSDEISLHDKNIIPIAYLQSYYAVNYVDEYDLAILENQKIELFTNPSTENPYNIISGINTFNLGKAGETYKTNDFFAKLREELKTELGIWSKATDVKTKNQL